MKNRLEYVSAVLLIGVFLGSLSSGKVKEVAAGAVMEPLTVNVKEANHNIKEQDESFPLKRTFHSEEDEITKLDYISYDINVSKEKIMLNEQTEITLKLSTDRDHFIKGEMRIVVEKDGKMYRDYLSLSKISSSEFKAEFIAENEEVSGTYHIEGLFFVDEDSVNHIMPPTTSTELFRVEGTLGGYLPEMNLSFSKDTYNTHEEALLTVTVENPLVDFEKGTVKMYLESNFFEEILIELHKVSPGKLQGKFLVTDTMKNGPYLIDHMTLDSLDYKIKVYQSTSDRYDYDYVDYAREFTEKIMIAGQKRDVTPPEIISYEIDRVRVPHDDVARVTIEIKEEESGIDYIYMLIESDTGDFGYRYFYHYKDNIYKAVIDTMYHPVIEGSKFIIHQIGALDKAGNGNFRFWEPETIIEYVNFENIFEIYGENRYQTAIEMSKLTESSDTVILALGTDFPDALSAGPLAYTLKAPILLSQNSRVSDSTLKEIKRRQAKKAVILGGSSAISYQVLTSLKEAGISDVKRISGKNRYGTAVSVAEELLHIQEGQNNKTKTAILANGIQFADALAAGSMASGNGYPILLTDGKKLHDDVSQFIENNDISVIYVVGGASVIGEEVLEDLKSRGIEVIRYAGSNRYTTSVDIALNSYPDSETAFVANGMDFADALAAAPLAARYKAPILLVSKDTLPKGVQSLISERGLTNLNKAHVVGGDAAVSMAVKKNISESIKKK